MSRIDKRLEGRGDGEVKKYLKSMADLFKQAEVTKRKRIASETPEEEFEMGATQDLMRFKEWQKNNPGKTYDDYLEEIGLKIKRIGLAGGSNGIKMQLSRETLLDFIKGSFPKDYIRMEKRLKTLDPDELMEELRYLTDVTDE